MPGLMRGVARTAVIAGTATAVSGRVARRQAEKYADRDGAIYAQQDAAYQAQTAPAAPAAYPPPVQYAEEPAEDPMIAKIKELASLHAQGILTDDEFATAKSKALAG